jgi:hypothetical protein
LAQSIAEPPPSATRPSCEPARYAATAASTLSALGLPGRSLNIAAPAGNSPSTRAAVPVATMPGSVISSGRAMPSAFSSFGSSASAPKSKRTGVTK